MTVGVGRLEEERELRTTNTRTVLADKIVATLMQEKKMMVQGIIRLNQQALKRNWLQVREREESWIPWIPSPAQEAQKKKFGRKSQFWTK